MELAEIAPAIVSAVEVTPRPEKFSSNPKIGQLFSLFCRRDGKGLFDPQTGELQIEQLPHLKRLGGRSRSQAGSDLCPPGVHLHDLTWQVDP